MRPTQYLYVYGSLRVGFQNEAYQYLSQYFTYVATGHTKGIMVDLGTHPAATATTDNTYIIGDLYELKPTAPFDWAFAQLDDYEGVNTEDDEQPMYTRSTTIVHIGDQEVTAQVYWYCGSIAGKPVIQSGNILDYINK